MTRIGLTGGIGSGKSTVADMLRGHGAVVIDADQIARDLVRPGQPALAALVAEFGGDILLPDGTLSRGLLAQRAFGDPAATERLNGIMHPRISAESRRQMDEAEDAAIVVYDMPLLVETGQQELVDLVIVVDVPVDIQMERAVALRGLDRQDVERRVTAQATREERLAVADVVIDNSGTLESTEDQVHRLWLSLVEHRG